MSDVPHSVDCGGFLDMVREAAARSADDRWREQERYETARAAESRVREQRAGTMMAIVLATYALRESGVKPDATVYDDAWWPERRRTLRPGWAKTLVRTISRNATPTPTRPVLDRGWCVHGSNPDAMRGTGQTMGFRDGSERTLVLSANPRTAGRLFVARTIRIEQDERTQWQLRAKAGEVVLTDPALRLRSGDREVDLRTHETLLDEGTPGLIRHFSGYGADSGNPWQLCASERWIAYDKSGVEQQTQQVIAEYVAKKVPQGVMVRCSEQVENTGIRQTLEDLAMNSPSNVGTS